MEPETILMLAGTGETPAIWTDFAGAGERARKLVMAAPGPGASLAEICAEFAHICQRPVHIVGHSLGALVAVELALLWPRTVTGLVLVSTSANADSYDDAIRRQAMVASLQQGSPVPWANAYIDRALPGGSAHPAAAKVREMIMAQSASTIIAQQTAVANRVDRHAALRTIACPAVVLCGEWDRITPFTHARKVARNLPQARLRLMRGTGHVPMLERPEAFSRLLERALRWTSSARHHLDLGAAA